MLQDESSNGLFQRPSRDSIIYRREQEIKIKLEQSEDHFNNDLESSRAESRKSIYSKGPQRDAQAEPVLQH